MLYSARSRVSTIVAFEKRQSKRKYYIPFVMVTLFYKFAPLLGF